MSPQPKKKHSKSREVEIDRGVYVVKGVAPKAGTKLTRDRIKADFRSLNGHGRGPGRDRPAEG
ncbi:MAG: hypothetical protein H0V21_06055 [Rubrobacter sp.]|nr:hypothetical protein [Rubrobacter sp.]